MNLDSLTDLVSNAVGVLILLLLMTTLQTRNPHADPPLPIEHHSALVPQFFYLSGDHIQAINVNAVFANGLLSAREVGVEAEFRIDADFTGRPDENLTLALSPLDVEHWPTLEDLERLDGALGERIGKIDNSAEFAFLFVRDQGEADVFASFHRVRQWFVNRGTAVGWLPVTDENPAYLCSWSDVRACDYRPIFYGRKQSG